MMEKWKCGHEPTLIVTDGNPLAISQWIRWSEIEEPKDCYKCFSKKERLKEFSPRYKKSFKKGVE